jgi:hypothetical protein
MKRFYQIAIALFIAVFSFSTLSAQENAGITFSMIKKDGKLIHRIKMELQVLDFTVAGLNSNAEVDAFIAKFKALESVADITISYDLVDNKRVGSATFQKKATHADMKNALLSSGVTQVIIDEKEININDVVIENTKK